MHFQHELEHPIGRIKDVLYASDQQKFVAAAAAAATAT
jgi:hypothetical protein